MNNRNRGRKKVKEEDRDRKIMNKQLPISLSKNDYEVLDEISDRLNMSKREIIRKCLYSNYEEFGV